MMNLKRVLCIAMALALSCSIMGCSSNSDTPESTSSQAQSKTSSAAQSEGELTTISVLSVSDATQLSYSDTENSKVWPHLGELLAQRGIQLDMEVLESDQYSTVLNTRIASGSKLADLVCVAWMDVSDRINMIKNGICIPLDEIIACGDQSGSLESAAYQLGPDGTYYLVRLLNTYMDGNMYFFTGVAANSGIDKGPYGLFDSFALQIRTDWLEKVNMDMPTSLDELTAALRAFQDQDVNGDSVNDERMVISVNAFNNGLAQLFGLAPFDYSVDLSNGQLVIPYDQEGFLPYIEYLSSLYAEGLFDPTDFANLSALLAADKVSATWHVSAHTSYAKMSSDPNAFMTYIPSFNAVEGIDSTMCYQVSIMPNGGYWCFTESVRDKMEAAADLLDFFFSKDYWLFHTFGVENLSYKVDENGLYVETFRQDYPTLEEQREAGIASGFWYGGANVLPRMTGGQVIWNLADSQRLFSDYNSLVNSEFYKNRNQVYENLGANGRWADNMQENMWPEGSFYNYTGNYYAMPTQEELDIVNQYTDLSTRVSEIVMNLIMGNYTTEDWPKYRAEMKELGFDELAAVYNAQAERLAKQLAE